MPRSTAIYWWNARVAEDEPRCAVEHAQALRIILATRPANKAAAGVGSASHQALRRHASRTPPNPYLRQRPNSPAIARCTGSPSRLSSVIPMPLAKRRHRKCHRPHPSLHSAQNRSGNSPHQILPCEEAVRACSLALAAATWWRHRLDKEKRQIGEINNLSQYQDVVGALEEIRTHDPQNSQSGAAQRSAFDCAPSIGWLCASTTALMIARP
jgi:hypothetical protein